MKKMFVATLLVLNAAVAYADGLDKESVYDCSASGISTTSCESICESAKPAPPSYPSSAFVCLAPVLHEAQDMGCYYMSPTGLGTGYRQISLQVDRWNRENDGFSLRPASPGFMAVAIREHSIQDDSYRPYVFRQACVCTFTRAMFSQNYVENTLGQDFYSFLDNNRCSQFE